MNMLRTTFTSEWLARLSPVVDAAVDPEVSTLAPLFSMDVWK